MRAPNAQQLNAIELLQKRGEAWEVFVAWLSDSQLRAQDQCVRADDDVSVRRLQGEARCLGELVSTLKPKQ
ncbi:hypothetical protein OKW38_002230 [Paraburkholderia sp. MM5496-R1]|uniref:hypothetical protein n=1 Tax=Paraburkholderia sp. MM5496-R1 TaxID=2991065 RepID=UPI003D21B60A